MQQALQSATGASPPPHTPAIMLRPRHYRGLLLALALATLALAPATVAAASPSYLGCFSTPALSPFFRESTTVKGTSPAALAAACITHCAGSNYPLAALRLGGSCSCSGVVPPTSAVLQARAAQCSEAALSDAASSAAVALFYAHNEPSERCRLANLGPLGASNIETSYNGLRVGFSPDGTLSLELSGTDGCRVHTADGDSLYGLYQWEVLPSGATGAVTGAYLRSDYNQETKDYSEVDWEFINGGAKEQGGAVPGALWLNSYADGISYGERLVQPSVYAPLTGGALSTSGFHTYTIDVQPTHVSWKLDGATLEHRTKGQRMTWMAWDGPKDRIFTPPNRPMHMTMSMWSDAIEGFGGANQGTTYSKFRNLRRVLCGAPLPAFPDAPLPTWLGGSGTAPPVTPPLEPVTPPVTSSGGSSTSTGTVTGGQTPSTEASAGSSSSSALLLPPSLLLNGPAREEAAAIVAAGGSPLQQMVGRMALTAVAAIARAFPPLALAARVG